MSIKLTQKPIRVHCDQIDFFSILPKPIPVLTDMERMKLQLDCKVNYDQIQRDKEAQSKKGILSFTTTE